MLEDRPADVVVFDPETVGAGGLERVFDFPAGADRLIAPEKGVRAVVVNGSVLRENGADALAPDGDLPGGVLAMVKLPHEPAYSLGNRLSACISRSLGVA